MPNSPEYERSRAKIPELARYDAKGRELIEFAASYDLGDGYEADDQLLGAQHPGCDRSRRPDAAKAGL